MRKTLLYVLILNLLVLTVLPACQFLKSTPTPQSTPAPQPAQTARPNPTTQLTQAARATPTSAPASPLLVRTPTPATPASAPPGAPAPLVSKILETSSSPQLVSYQDRVGVIIPAGTLQSRQTVTISPAPNLPAHPSKGFTQLAAYDVSMGNVREFKEPLTIEIAYDPATIPSNIPPDKALSVAWWDAGLKAWVNAPFAVDTTRNVIMIPTTHLSVWEVVALTKSWALKETEHFKIYFDPGSSFNVGGSTGPAANMATEVGTSLEKAYKAYDDAKFSMRLTFIPTTAIGTFMGTLTGGIIGGVAGGYAGGLAGARAGLNAGGRIGATIGTAAGAILVGSKTYVILDQATVSAEWNKMYTGEIYVPLKHTSYDELRHDLAHELFHAVQNGYFSVAESGGPIADYLGTNGHWWIEATADYAPVSVGLSNLDALPKITPKYFQQALPTEGNEREYITSRFIAYMAKRGVDFKSMWDVAACLACTERLTATMLRRVEMYHDQRQPNLHNRFRTFAAEMFFDSNSPLELGTGKTLETSGAVSQNTRLSATDSTISYTFKLPADYTAQLWRIPVEFNSSQTERSLKVEVIGAMPSRDRVTVTASVLPNDQRVLTSVTTKLLNEGNQTANVTVKKNDTIYIMAVNSLTTDLSLTVKVTDVSLIISPPTASVDAGKNVTFTTPGVKEKVLWTVQEGASGGTITAAGVYTAPDKTGTFHVVATLESDRTKTATATITTTKAAGSTPVVAIPTTTSLKLEIPGYWGHLSYTITGAQLDPPTGGDRGRVAGRQYQGKLAGNTLTVSGTAVSDNVSSGPGSGDYYELVVSVTVGKENKKFEYIAPKGEKMSKPFSLSVPVDPGATSGSFSISLLEQNANNGVYGWVVGGSLTR